VSAGRPSVARGAACLTLYGPARRGGAASSDVPIAREVEVPADLAGRFAEAHRRLRPGPVGVHLGDGEVRILGPSRPDDHRPDGAGDDASPDEVAEALRTGRRPVVLAGPGVVLLDRVDALRAVAEAANIGVLNTWGAKGVFDWRSPHHLGTVGLQARDAELVGLADADPVVATGLDEHELGTAWRTVPLVEVDPRSLDALAARVTPRSEPIARPPLFEALAAVTQAGWERTEAPLAPSRVTRTYGELLGRAGVVAADPGVAGFWVARTVPTERVRGVVVPGDPAATGAAVATAVVSRLLDPDRPALAVVDRLDDVGRAVLDAAARLGVAVAVERWCDDGELLDADCHRERLVDLLGTGGEVALAIDPTQLAEFVTVAGEVTAWGGLA
jgi:thiamine pyrophosphate-dependent acetolactate synthase large subunit-like protein